MIWVLEEKCLPEVCLHEIGQKSSQNLKKAAIHSQWLSHVLTFLLLPYVYIGQTHNPNRGFVCFLTRLWAFRCSVVTQKYRRHSSTQPQIIVEFHETPTDRFLEAEERRNIRSADRRVEVKLQKRVRWKLPVLAQNVKLSPGSQTRQPVLLLVKWNLRRWRTVLCWGMGVERLFFPHFSTWTAPGSVTRKRKT